MNKFNAKSGNGRRAGNRQPKKNKGSTLPNNRLVTIPDLLPTIAKVHTFRYRNGGTAAVTIWTAQDLLGILLATTAASTAAIEVITSYRIVRVDMYFALAGASTTSGIQDGPSLSWSTGAGALTEEGKASSRATSITYQQVTGHASLVPGPKSTQGFWYNDSAAGDAFEVNVGNNNFATVVDITLEFTMSDAAAPGRARTLGGAASTTGFSQLGKTSYATVGFIQAV